MASYTSPFPSVTSIRCLSCSPRGPWYFFGRNVRASRAKLNRDVMVFAIHSASPFEESAPSRPIARATEDTVMAGRGQEEG